jgi:hypothetical protein
VRRAATTNDGTIHVFLRSTTGKWPDIRWWKVPAGTPGASSFLAIALTCISTGLRAVVTMDAAVNTGDDLHYIGVFRA